MTTVLYGSEPENTYLDNYTLYLFYSKLIYESLLIRFSEDNASENLMYTWVTWGLAKMQIFIQWI